MNGRRAFMSGAALGISASLFPSTSFGEHREQQRFKLRDGRSLGFATYGDPSNWPVLYFHGIPTSRIEARFFETAAEQNGCYLVAIDRPGIGLSDFQRGRRIVDWAADVREFVDGRSLPADVNLQEFSVVSFSSGSAYALMCAAQLPPGRIKSIAVISGVAPLEAIVGHGGYAQFGFGLAKRRPKISNAAFNIGTKRINQNATRFLRKFSRFYAAADSRIFFEPRNAQILIDSYLECVRCGNRGVLHDMTLLANPWGFQLTQIEQPTRLWYGTSDITTPISSMGNYLNRAIPGSVLHQVVGQGHLSMLDSVGPAIFRELISDID